ncbi:MAG: OB-fold nucleic acid binding domain-containing protein, partial [Gammaproteobacteria bacterium]
HGRISALADLVDKNHNKTEARAAGLVVELRTRQTKQGKSIAFATLDDGTGQMEVAVYTEAFEKHRDILSRNDLPIVVEGSLGIDSFSGMLRLTADRIYTMDQARAEFARNISIEWKTAGKELNGNLSINKLEEAMRPFCGGNCPVVIRYQTNKARTVVQLGDNWRLHPSDELLHCLKTLSGVDAVQVRY